MKCHRCQSDLVGKPHYSEQIGYVKDRGATGGANHLLKRRSTGRLLCEACLHLTDRKSEQGQLAI